MKQTKLIAQVLKFGVTGATASAVHLGLLYVFVEFFGWMLAVSVAAAFLAAFAVSFTLQKFWTFQDSSTDRLHGQAGLYFLTAVTALFANVFGVQALVTFLGLWYMAAQFIVLLFVSAVTFFVYKFVIFARRGTVQHGII